MTQSHRPSIADYAMLKHAAKIGFAIGDASDMVLRKALQDVAKDALATMNSMTQLPRDQRDYAQMQQALRRIVNVTGTLVANAVVPLVSTFATTSCAMSEHDSQKFTLKEVEDLIADVTPVIMSQAAQLAYATLQGFVKAADESAATKAAAAAKAEAAVKAMMEDELDIESDAAKAALAAVMSMVRKDS